MIKQNLQHSSRNLSLPFRVSNIHSIRGAILTKLKLPIVSRNLRVLAHRSTLLFEECRVSPTHPATKTKQHHRVRLHRRHHRRRRRHRLDYAGEQFSEHVLRAWSGWNELISRVCRHRFESLSCAGMPEDSLR